MSSPPLYYVATDPDAFRPGEPARVIGYCFLTGKDGSVKLAYDVEYADGVTDQCPIATVSAYALTLTPNPNPLRHDFAT